MITILFIIIFNIYLYKKLKIKKNEIEKDNIKYIRKKDHKKIKFYKIYPKMILSNTLFLTCWIIISLLINFFLLENFEKNIERGFLKYQILKENNLKEIENNYFVYGYETIDDNDKSKYRAYYYILEDGEEIGKSLDNGIILNISNENKEYEGNLVYDNFLRSFFIQFYSYQYKQVNCIEENIKFLEYQK